MKTINLAHLPDNTNNCFYHVTRSIDNPLCGRSWATTVHFLTITGAHDFSRNITSLLISLFIAVAVTFSRLFVNHTYINLYYVGNVMTCHCAHARQISSARGRKTYNNLMVLSAIIESYQGRDCKFALTNWKCRKRICGSYSISSRSSMPSKSILFWLFNEFCACLSLILIKRCVS